jgi:hypothetical protein
MSAIAKEISPRLLSFWDRLTPQQLFVSSFLALILFGFGIIALAGHIDLGWLHGLIVVAVPVVAYALWGMARSLTPDAPRITLAALAAIVVLIWPTPIGFIGAIALFVVIGLLLWRTMQVAHVTQDSFGQLLAIGITAMIFFQAFVNIGMNVGIMPVTGIPLPFISLGGSSLWTSLAALGLLQSVRIHHQRLAFQRE